MKKKEEPVIRYTEILSRAARALEAEVSEWERRCEGLPNCEDMLDRSTADLKKKLEAIRTMYHIETGTEL